MPDFVYQLYLLVLLTYVQINLIHNAHLPGVTVGVGITIEPLEDEDIDGRYVLLSKVYELVISIST